MARAGGPLPAITAARTRDFRHLSRAGACARLAAMARPQSREQWLLVASGLAAIAIVTWILWIGTGSRALLGVNILFALVFLSSSLDEPLGLPAAWGRLAMPLLLALNAAAVALYPYQVTLILAVVLAASAPYHLTARASWLLVIAGNLLFALLISARGLSGGEVAGLLTLLALQGFAISSSVARRRDEQSRQALAQQNRELQAARAVLAQQSQAEERLRIAGALHDTIGHRLTALQLQLEALAHEAPAGLREQVLTCKGVAAELLEDVRAIVRDMPGAAAPDLHTALRELAQALPGISLRVGDGLPAVDGPCAQQLLCCLQEAIHNAVRHGGADEIRIGWADGRFLVEDNGRGLPAHPPQPGFGLRNMNRRLAAFGGAAELQPAPGGRGCRLLLSLPGDGA